MQLSNCKMSNSAFHCISLNNFTSMYFRIIIDRNVFPFGRYIALPPHNWHRRHRVNPKFGTLVKHTRDTRVRIMCAHAVRYGRRVRSSVAVQIPLIHMIMRYYARLRFVHNFKFLLTKYKQSIVMQSHAQTAVTRNALIQLKWDTYDMAKYSLNFGYVNTEFPN